MKKLTAGIFAGILTIVSVNAADAAIASKAYVDQQDNANKALIQTNTTNITNLTTTVGADANSGLQKAVADLQTSVEGLAGEGTGSVADQIADALTDYTTTADMNTELGKKQDKSTVDYALGTAAGGWEPLTDAEKAALQSGVDTADVAQITTNKEAIAAMDTAYKAADTTINATIGTVPTGKTVVGLIDEAKTAASGDVDAKLGDLPEGSTVKAELDKKQNLLNNTNVTTTGEGNVISAVTAADGTVTATKGINAVTVPASNAPVETGTYVLTATVDASGVPTYYWESIERAAATPAQ